MTLRILLTGGGTGGHIYPLIAVNEELRKIAKEKNIDLDIRYFGVPNDYRSALEKEGIAVSKIIGAKRRRYFDPRNLIDFLKFFFSIFQLLGKIFFFMPNVVFSKGGPGALAVVIVARFYRIPVIIHESDSTPGLTNQISAHFAERIAISFPSAAEYFSDKIASVGNPIRVSLVENQGDSSTAKQMLGFIKTKPLILFINGSQGATRINDFILDNIKDLVGSFQILQQTGAANFINVKREMEIATANLTNEEKMSYKIVPYFDNNLKDAYTAADVIVSRAGSGSIFEIAAFKKPSILIPLPEAASDHQLKNAYEYFKTGAAVIIEANNLTPNILINEIKKIISDPARLQKMSEAAKNFYKPEAAKLIAEEIIKLGSRG